MSAKKIAGIPDYKQRQKILYIDKTPPEELARFADMLLVQNRYSEAFDYLERMGDAERLRSFMNDAKERGDFFNFERTARKLNLEVERGEWEELARKAVEKGLIRYAVEAYRRAGNRQKARELIAEFPQLFEPVLESGKPVAELEEEEEEKKEISTKGAKPPLPAPEEKPALKVEPSKPAVEKDPQQAAREAAMKALKKKWRKKKK